MSEDELRALFDEIGELTEAAQRALEGEISRRRLNFQPRNPASVAPGASAMDLVVQLRVHDVAEARRAMETLHSAGVPCYFGPDDLIDVDLFLSSFENGVDLKVRSVDRERARAALSRPWPPDSADTGEDLTRCSRCHSPQIGLQQIDEEPEVEPNQEPKFCWSCDSCGHQWDDSEVEKGS